MKLSSTVSITIAFVLSQFHFVAFAETGDAGVGDRIAIQEKLLYAYAYTYDSKDCFGWSNLFTTDAVLELPNMKANGRDAIRQACIARQKIVGSMKLHHNMMNIVFDLLTPSRAETRTYVVLTSQKAGDQTINIQGVGVYHDVIVKSDDGRWLFKERRDRLETLHRHRDSCSRIFLEPRLQTHQRFVLVLSMFVWVLSTLKIGFLKILKLVFLEKLRHSALAPLSRPAGTCTDSTHPRLRFRYHQESQAFFSGEDRRRVDGSVQRTRSALTCCTSTICSRNYRHTSERTMHGMPIKYGETAHVDIDCNTTIGLKSCTGEKVLSTPILP